ncbi:hypothetical protein FJT64_026479 [Amphibalanus amphitrite]|uniref:Uncharacterized protein n=1 Tax=Amphibalanus amphitrite TaxID=1232801 RepID=A0A6A4W5F1_AMPAM|nr:hypothetical protein FJT64_026479 [Amphibalanus amphitrite]
MAEPSEPWTPARHRQREPPADLALLERRSSSAGRCRSGGSSPYQQRHLDDDTLRLQSRSACCVHQATASWSERPTRSTSHLQGCARDPAAPCGSRPRHRHRHPAGRSSSRSRSGDRSRHRERRRLPRQAHSLDCRPQTGRAPLLRQSTVAVASDEEYVPGSPAPLHHCRSPVGSCRSPVGSCRSPLGSCRSPLGSYRSPLGSRRSGLGRQSTCEIPEDFGPRRSAASSVVSRSGLSCSASLVDLGSGGAEMAAPMLPVLAQVLCTRAALARRGEKRPDQRLRWAVIITGLLLLAAAVVMVGVTLKMAPNIDDVGEWRPSAV